MLAALGLRCSSDGRIGFSVNIHKTLALESLSRVCSDGEKNGVLSGFDAGREKRQPVIRRIKAADPRIVMKWYEFGRPQYRASYHRSGTTSLMSADDLGYQATYFSVYKREEELNPNDKDVKSSFVDEVGILGELHRFSPRLGGGWKLTDLIRPGITSSGAEELVRKSPYYKATSNDVDYSVKYGCGEQFSNALDHSISVTINMPADVTENCGACYLEAWKAELQGSDRLRSGSAGVGR